MEQQTRTVALRDSSTAYGLVSRLNHWITAAAIIAMLISGLVMANGNFARETVFAIMAPLASILIAMGVFTVIMIYLGTFRPGNHVTVTGGDHVGKNGVVTQRHGLSASGWVHVHIPDDELDTTISPYQIKKAGWRSHVF